MPSAKFALAAALAAVSLSACGSSARPEAGTLKAVAAADKRVDDPRKKHIQCLQQDRIPVRRTVSGGLPALQVGDPGSGPTVEFQPTPGAAQEMQIEGRAQSAEVIGSALLYPRQASSALLKQVEDCMAKGVSG